MAKKSSPNYRSKMYTNDEKVTDVKLDKFNALENPKEYISYIKQDVYV